MQMIMSIICNLVYKWSGTLDKIWVSYTVSNKLVAAVKLSQAERLSGALNFRLGAWGFESQPTCHVPVPELQLLGLAKPDAVDDGRVVELVRDDDVIGSQQLLENSGVGVEAAGVQDGVLTAVELGDLALQILGCWNENSLARRKDCSTQLHLKRLKFSLFENAVQRFFYSICACQEFY